MFLSPEVGVIRFPYDDIDLARFLLGFVGSGFDGFVLVQISSAAPAGSSLNSLPGYLGHILQSLF